MKSISINLSPEDLITIDQVTRYAPLATRHAVARAAMRLGLVQMAGDKDVAVDQLVAQVQRRSHEEVCDA